MRAKEAVTHIVSFLPESMSFEEIIQALSLIYSDRCGLPDCGDMNFFKTNSTDTADSVPMQQYSM
jgi:hypothetical protein